MRWLLQTSCCFDLPVISSVFARVPYCRGLDSWGFLHFFALNWQMIESIQCFGMGVMLHSFVIWYSMNQSLIASTRAQTIRGGLAVIVSTRFWDFWSTQQNYNSVFYIYMQYIFCRCGVEGGCHIIQRVFIQVLCGLTKRPGHGAWQKRLVLDEGRALIFSVPRCCWFTWQVFKGLRGRKGKNMVVTYLMPNNNYIFLMRWRNTNMKAWGVSPTIHLWCLLTYWWLFSQMRNVSLKHLGPRIVDPVVCSRCLVCP